MRVSWSPLATTLPSWITTTTSAFFTVLDRRAWIEVNLKLFQDLLNPVLKLQEMLPASYATDLGRRGISEYMGVLLGFLSRRVLGQYDPVLMAAPGSAQATALYLVEPNIEQ